MENLSKYLVTGVVHNFAYPTDINMVVEAYSPKQAQLKAMLEFLKGKNVDMNSRKVIWNQFKRMKVIKQ